MTHRDGSSDPTAGPVERDPADVQPDYAREDRDPAGREVETGELGSPNFATTDIDPGEPDPIPPGTPNFATRDIDPGEPDPIDPTRPTFATRDQDLS